MFLRENKKKIITGRFLMRYFDVMPFASSRVAQNDSVLLSILFNKFNTNNCWFCRGNACWLNEKRVKPGRYTVFKLEEMLQRASDKTYKKTVPLRSPFSLF